MTDEITQNDCHGEQMYSAEIPINIELGSAGLYYGTSPQMKGLLVTGHTIKEVMDRVPNAIAEMRAVAAMGPEIARLREQLTEAREIIGESLQVLDMLSNEFFPEIAAFVETVGLYDQAEKIRKVMPRADADLPTRARAFLTEKSNG